MSLRIRMLAVSAVVVVVAVPGIAVAATGGGGTTADARMVADAKRTEAATVSAWNDKKWDELRRLYAEDAVLLPPNHEPVQGRDAIVDYFKGVRDVFGEIDDGWEYVRVKANGDTVNLVARATTRSGRVRLIWDDLYERQPDGSVLLAVDQIGLRQQAVG